MYDYKVKDKIVDVTDPSKATADVIYVWGGHLLYYDKRPTTDQIVNAVAERKAVADKLKILRYRPIKDIADKLDPFGLAIYNDKGELIYTVDGNGKITRWMIITCLLHILPVHTIPARPQSMSIVQARITIM